MDANATAALALDWPTIQTITCGIAEHVAATGPPEIAVGIARGGLVPAVMFAHLLQIRDLRVLDVTHTTADGINAPKHPEPVVRNPDSLGDLAGRDVLLIDDIAGSGRTLAAASNRIHAAGAARVRTVVCALNDVNWRAATDVDPTQVITHIGVRYSGWVIFPWEQR